MAILKKDVKKITISISKDFSDELTEHLKNFALTNRGQWIVEAAKERMAKEKQMLSELDEEE